QQYTMRESNGSEDLIFQESCIGLDGKIKVSDLWKKRIKRCMVNPIFTDHEWNELSHKEMNFLIAKWLEINEVNVESFLGDSIQAKSND
ncbi:MAG: hypothetical protein ACKO7N_07700, partial [Candidatus Nitrosotenuis sp.]